MSFWTWIFCIVMGCLLVVGVVANYEIAKCRKTCREAGLSYETAIVGGECFCSEIPVRRVSGQLAHPKEEK